MIHLDGYDVAQFAADLGNSIREPLLYVAAVLAPTLAGVFAFIGVRRGIRFVLVVLAERAADGASGELTRADWDAMSDYDKGGYTFEEASGRGH